MTGQQYALERYREGFMEKRKTRSQIEAENERDAQVLVDVQHWLLTELREWGAYVFHDASTGSKYLKMPHWGLGSIRIANHEGYEKYSYKWKVRVDLQTGDRSKGVYAAGELNQLVRDFLANADARGILPGDAQTWEEYQGRSVPEWKQKKINKGMARRTAE